MLTLDDWCAKVIKVLLREKHTETPIIFVAFIFIANYFFLNIMVAFSCENFKIINNERYLELKKNPELDFFEGEVENRKVLNSIE